MLRSVTAGLLLMALGVMPVLPQEQAPTAVRAVKYAGLAAAVAQQRGKVVVVDLWASFCQPCKEGFPRILALQRQYAERGLVVIAVSLDAAADRPRAEQFLRQQHASCINLWLDEPPEFWTERFRTNSIPCLFVFDRLGRWTRFGGDANLDHQAVEQFVVKLLAE